MIIKKMVKILIRWIMVFFRIIPINSNKIVFSAFSGRFYGDNPKYIAEYIVKHKLPYNCVFVLENPKSESVPKEITVVKYNSIRYLYEMATAKVWIDNTRKQPHILKRKGQFYFQTWHGTISLKRAERDVERNLAESYVKTAINDSKNIDTLLVTNDWGEEYFKQFFWYSGPILKCGSPRLDLLFDYDLKLVDIIKQKIGVKKTEKIVLYSPTFRRDSSLKVYNIDYKLLKRSLEKRFGGEWKVIIKLHPNIKQLKLEIPQDVIDVTQYSDMTELYLISDFMITDYSSTMFDFSVLGKAAVLYASDVEEYMNDRDFVFNINELPYPLAQNNSELEAIITNFDEERYKMNLINFQRRVGLREDGKGAETIMNYITEKIRSSV